MLIKTEKIKLDDLDIVLGIVTQFWGDTVLVVHGKEYQTADLDGLKALIDNEIVGVLHYKFRNKICEILTLASLRPCQGIGSALLTSVESLARSHQCKKLCLITTNDNLQALGFYQRRGYHLAALYQGKVCISRQIKPSIPLVGENNIPLRDELLLEKQI